MIPEGNPRATQYYYYYYYYYYCKSSSYVGLFAERIQTNVFRSPFAPEIFVTPVCRAPIRTLEHHPKLPDFARLVPDKSLCQARDKNMSLHI